MAGNTSREYRMLCCHRPYPKLIEGVGGNLVRRLIVETETGIRLSGPGAVKTLMVKGGGKTLVGEAALQSWR